MILGLVEHDRGKLNALSFQMLTLGRRLAEQLPAYGVSSVHLVRHDQLNDYAPEAWAQSVVELIESTQPEAVMAAGSDRGNEVMAHLGARTNLPMAANCTEVQPGVPYRVTRLRWGGSLLEEANLKGTPRLLTVAPHVIAAEQVATAGEVQVNEVTPNLNEKDLR